MTDQAAAYDELPYPSLPRPETQPGRLATVAWLLGLRPAPLDGCRVLELGCSDGGNLAATASAHPGAEVVGIDLSPRQVEDGRAMARSLGLTNLRLEVMDLREAPGLGTFDYVVAHGLYSWVAPPVQEALLSAMRACLREQGVAYLSYATLPGWHALGGVRAMLRQAVAAVADPRERVRQARAFLELLANFAPESAGLHRALLRQECALVRDKSDAYVRHELLSEEHHPAYFHEVAAAAARHGLQYLSEVEPQTSMAATWLAAEGQEALAKVARTPLEREQALDLVIGRSLRRSLFVRADAAPTRKVTPARLAGLHAAARAHPDATAPGLATPGPLRFVGPGGVDLSVRHPLARAALVHLSRVWPRAVPCDDLPARAHEEAAAAGAPVPAGPADATALGEFLLQAWTRNAIELHLGPPRFASEPGERPTALPLARLRAARGDVVTNARHEAVALQGVEPALLPLLDGSRDRGALARELRLQLATGVLSIEGAGPEPEQHVPAAVDAALGRLARAALLV